MKYCYTLILLLTFILAGVTQDSLENYDGLLIGYTESTYDNNIVEAGEFVVISLDTIEIIDEIGGSLYEIRWKNSTPLMSGYRRKDDLISVKDGLWTKKDSLGCVIQKSKYHLGIEIWEKNYNPDGKLIEHSYFDTKSDTKYSDYYYNDVIFKRAFYPPENLNKETVLYYPESTFGVSDAEIELKANFEYKPISTDTVKLFSKSNESLQINKIEYNSSEIELLTIDGKVINSNTRINVIDTLDIQIVYKPHPNKPITKDTIAIRTQLGEYSIFFNSSSSHIDYKNVEKIEMIELSRERDKNLVVSPLGTITEVFIYEMSTKGRNGKELFRKSVYDLTKIALNNFEIGTYILFIPSCHTGGILTLKIIK